jgi:hypothetical protein
MKQRIFSHFQDYLIQYISHQYQDLLYCNSSQYILSTYNSQHNNNNNVVLAMTMPYSGQGKLPKSREETIEILSEYELLSCQREDMIYTTVKNSNTIMFTTKTNLKFICQDVHLFGDGTFQYCAKFFHQLYTLHAYKNGQYVPCVFFLLPCKSKECYVSMFKHLLDSCARYNLSLNVSYIHFDFEVAVHDAAK